MHGKINFYVLRFRPGITLKTSLSVACNLYSGIHTSSRAGAVLRKRIEHQRESAPDDQESDRAGFGDCFGRRKIQVQSASHLHGRAG